jgi:beta-mannosidase
MMQKYDLNGHWLMRQAGTEKWNDAVVPGSVYSDLLRLNKMENPFYRENEKAAAALSADDYEYERTFELSDEFLKYNRIFLHCDGLDTLCRISLNGCEIANTCNMHRTYEFEVKKYLKSDKNTIHIVFQSPTRYVEKKQKDYPLFNGSLIDKGGVSYLRKAHYMFGWDWGPVLPDMGIWRSIYLCGANTARIQTYLVHQQHEEGFVGVTADILLDRYADRSLQVSLKMTSPEGRVFSSEVETDTQKASLKLEIGDPQIWWPNGMGKHPLYKAEIELKMDGNVLDKRCFRIGLRTIRLKQEKDEWGKSFCLTVNGVEMFAMGANYIPEDNILSRRSREKTVKLIKSCVCANFNMLRVWGGGFFPEDYFYDLCDENGIVVWQDMMFACGIYDFSPEFKSNIGNEMEDALRRIRHHACLGLICGNNEQEWEWVTDEKFIAAKPELKADYIKQFETFMPEIARKCAPDIPYWLASPSSGGSFDKPNSESSGDMHYWEVWHGGKPLCDYLNISPRFVSEFGLQSFPCLKTIKSYTLPSDRNPFSAVMESHQKDNNGTQKMLNYIFQSCKYPKDFNSLLYVSQIVQAEGIRCGVEHFRRLREKCKGAIYWQLNDCWPVASWSSIDYFGRWKALHYAAKRFFAPVLISAYKSGDKVSFYIVNDTTEKFKGNLSWRLMEQDGSELLSNRLTVEAPALTSRKCDECDFSNCLQVEDKKRSAYLKYTLTDGNGNLVGTAALTFVLPKYFDLRDPGLSFSVVERGDRFEVTVAASSFARFVELDFEDADAVFSDNYFDLAAGEKRKIAVEKKNMSVDMTCLQFKNKLMLRSLYDTVEK